MFSNGTCLLTAGSAHETVICYCKAFNGVYLSTKDSGRHQDTEGAVSNLSFIALPTPHLCLSVCHGKDYKNVFITFDMSVDFLLFVGMY